MLDAVAHGGGNLVPVFKAKVASLQQRPIVVLVHSSNDRRDLALEVDQAVDVAIDLGLQIDQLVNGVSHDGGGAVGTPGNPGKHNA